MKTALKALLGLVLLAALTAGGAYGWASAKSRSVLARSIPAHSVDFPVPFPLSGEEREQVLRERAAAGEDASTPTEEEWAALATERALERGRHLVESRYVCVECHGRDFGGGVMVDNAAIGRLLGPNITTGEGSRTAGYTVADWDRIVRHGIKPDGTPAAMPSEDFVRMTDQELSDVIAYVRSHPPVDASVPPPSLGPLGKILLATGKLPLSADKIPDHQSAHGTVPPAPAADAGYGAHVAAVCTGCHTAAFTGGKVPGGDPAWPPAANLTRHHDGLAGWTFEQFDAVMRTGRRPDGTELLNPMLGVVQYTKNMTDTEMRALWAYLESVPPQPSPR